MQLSAFKSPRCNNLTLSLIRLPRCCCNRIQNLNDENKNPKFVRQATRQHRCGKETALRLTHRLSFEAKD